MNSLDHGRLAAPGHCQPERIRIVNACKRPSVLPGHGRMRLEERIRTVNGCMRQSLLLDHGCFAAPGLSALLDHGRFAAPGFCQPCWIMGVSLRQDSVSHAANTTRIWMRESMSAKERQCAENLLHQKRNVADSVCKRQAHLLDHGRFSAPGLSQPCNGYDQDSQGGREAMDSTVVGSLVLDHGRRRLDGWIRIVLCKEGPCLASQNDTLTQPWSEPQHAACTPRVALQRQPQNTGSGRKFIRQITLQTPGRFSSNVRDKPTKGTRGSLTAQQTKQAKHCPRSRPKKHSLPSLAAGSH